jgi:DNA-binding NarL/FixJ family response regulator
MNIGPHIRVLVQSPRPIWQAGLTALLLGLVAMHPHLEIAPSEGQADLLLSDDEDLAAETPLPVVLLSENQRLDWPRLREKLPNLAIIPADADGELLMAAITALQNKLVLIPAEVLNEMLSEWRNESYSENHGENHGDSYNEARAITNDSLQQQHEEINLTPREREILALLSEGYSNKQMARSLGLSDHTVKFHVSSILGKLGANGRADAVSKGLRWGLVVL